MEGEGVIGLGEPGVVYPSLFIRWKIRTGRWTAEVGSNGGNEIGVTVSSRCNGSRNVSDPTGTVSTSGTLVVRWVVLRCGARPGEEGGAWFQRSIGTEAVGVVSGVHFGFVGGALVVGVSNLVHGVDDIDLSPCWALDLRCSISSLQLTAESWSLVSGKRAQH